MDTSNFSEEFTNMKPAYSPAVVPLHGEKIFQVSTDVKGVKESVFIHLYVHLLVISSIVHSINLDLYVSIHLYMHLYISVHLSLSLYIYKCIFLSMYLFPNLPTLWFQGYSYVAPSILFSDNEITSDFLQPSLKNRPGDKHICLASKFQNSPFFQQYELNVQDGILGDGTFSVVRSCIHKQTKTMYAVKIVSSRVDASREVQLLKMCQGHPNIVRLHEVFHDQVCTILETNIA